MNEQELSKALDAIAAANPANAAAAAVGKPCDVYKNDVRPKVVAVLPVIRIVAPKIAAVIETLMGLADQLCP